MWRALSCARRSLVLLLFEDITVIGRNAVDHDVVQLQDSGGVGARYRSVALGLDRAAMHLHDRRLAILLLAQADGDRSRAGMQFRVDDLQRAAGLDAGALRAVARLRISKLATPDHVVAFHPDARAEFAGIGAAVLDGDVRGLEVESAVAHAGSLALADGDVLGLALAHDAVA